MGVVSGFMDIDGPADGPGGRGFHGPRVLLPRSQGWLGAGQGTCGRALIRQLRVLIPGRDQPQVNRGQPRAVEGAQLAGGQHHPDPGADQPGRHRITALADADPRIPVDPRPQTAAVANGSGGSGGGGSSSSSSSRLRSAAKSSPTVAARPAMCRASSAASASASRAFSSASDVARGTGTNQRRRNRRSRP
jgi:hypothetical protein